MKVKISEYTPFLLVGLIIVVIARHFYNPMQLVDMWEFVQEGEDMSMPAPVVEGIINVFCPTLMSMMEFEGYLANAIVATETSSFAVAFVAELACLGYLVITYLLEKIHAYWHEEEGVFAMCVDMLCIENIVLYIFNLICYVISVIFRSLNLPDILYGVLVFLIALPTFWGFLFQAAYAMTNVLISVVFPLLVFILLMKVIDQTIASLILIALMLVCSQVIWRLCSEFIYDKLLRVFTRNYLSLSD